MPIEIHELIITAAVSPKGGAGEKKAEGGGGGGGGAKGAPQKQVVEVCVEQVMDILQRKNER